MTALDILVTISLAVSGWTLLKVIRLGEMMAALSERTNHLPCVGCPSYKEEK